MLMNWPERAWIYSPFRILTQMREVKEWLRLRPKSPIDKALEIGCGLGRGARLLVEEMRASTVFAFDLDETLVHRAARNAPKTFLEYTSFFVGDAQDLPFCDSSFDAVVNFGIIHHVLDWRRCIREISRVTREGGIFYFEEIYPPLYANPILRRMLRHPRQDRFDENQFLRELASNNFFLLDGVRKGSRLRIVGAAEKR
jgi:ubiquinone/menaquinone biosynthesis C-methylase UbiE